MDERTMKLLGETLTAGNERLKARLEELRAFKARLMLNRGIPDAAKEELLIERLSPVLKEVVDHLHDVNDVFPETRAFLDARGLKSTRDLDQASLRDLRAHMLAEIERLRKKGSHDGK